MTSLLKKNKFRFPRINQIPIGERNGVNLDYTIPNGEEYVSGTLEVFIDQGAICPQSFIETGVNTFQIVVDKFDPNMRNKPIRDSETLWVNYYRKPKCK